MFLYREKAMTFTNSNHGKQVNMADDIQTLSGISKVRTGIAGFDDITDGGLPQGRPTLVVGSAGAGKTLFAMEFLVHGALEYDEPGVFFAFEENAEELTQNVASLGFDVKGLENAGRLLIDHIHIERSEIEETGEYDLEGLFIRIGLAIDTIGAKRIVLDTYSRSTLQRAVERKHPAGRTTPPVPLAERSECHNGHHRRAGQWQVYQAWPGRICFGRCYLP